MRLYYGQACAEGRRLIFSPASRGDDLEQRSGSASLATGIEIAHHDAEHLSRQSGLALGDVHAAAELAGLIGQNRGRRAVTVGDGRIRRWRSRRIWPSQSSHQLYIPGIGIISSTLNRSVGGTVMRMILQQIGDRTLGFRLQDGKPSYLAVALANGDDPATVRRVAERHAEIDDRLLRLLRPTLSTDPCPLSSARCRARYLLPPPVRWICKARGISIISPLLTLVSYNIHD
jgi:hypothetical protein